MNYLESGRFDGNVSNLLYVWMDQAFINWGINKITNINKMVSSRDVLRELKIKKLPKIPWLNDTKETVDLMLNQSFNPELYGQQIHLDYQLSLSHDLFCSEFPASKRTGIYIQESGNNTIILNFAVNQLILSKESNEWLVN